MFNIIDSLNALYRVSKRPCVHNWRIHSLAVAFLFNVFKGLLGLCFTSFGYR